uniref:TFIIE beta domain-containing protein n=1 Tax=Rhodosorus marinus TaxID=101924 RepID=A0A7S2ZS69_9RHOD|mmetsp:Transcript_29845/g.114586  ORF Transcript_29845/g.114586 Transcript_29845/m.114586 type:complete len:137 (+) Transcript_29845:477-887(+)
MSKPQTLNMQIKSVLDVLRKELRPMTPEEIEKILGTDIVNNQELRKNVESSTKFLRERDGRWRWKSQYYIRNKDELLVFLRKRHDGVPRAALDDCYKGVTDDMKVGVQGCSGLLGDHGLLTVLPYTIFFLPGYHKQ